MIVNTNHEILNKYRRQSNNHIFILFHVISLMLLSCSKNSVANEMQQNLESAGETEKYEVYIMSTNGGGNIIISSQGDRFFWNTTTGWMIWNYALGSQGVVSESDLNQVIEINSKAGTLIDDNYIGKFAGAFNPGTKLNVNISTNEGFSFRGWTGYKCVKCYWVMTPYANNESSMEITVDKNILLTANFEKIP